VGCSKISESAVVAESGPILGDCEVGQTCPTILLVEDEDFVREVTCEVLQSAGYRVLKAREATEATTMFRRHACDVQLLITDVVMPGQNGRDLARELSSACPGLPTLFVSGYPEGGRGKDSDQERAIFYLPKPFSAKSLIQAVGSILNSEKGEVVRSAACNG
jgi:CheY-like chemotaxis protein